MYREINPFEVSILEQPAGHACFPRCITEVATRIARWLNGYTLCVCGKSGEEFIQPLRAAKLCAPGMVVVCRNAAVLSHHRAPPRIHSPPFFFLFLFFLSFFLFLIRDPVSGIIKVKEIGDWSSDSRSESCDRARH